MLSSSKPLSQIEQIDHCPDESMALLMWVDFKWLMAGQGWWVDTFRFHHDPVYADGFLRLAMASPSFALRECAACLQQVLITLSPDDRVDRVDRVDSYKDDKYLTSSVDSTH